MEFPLEIWRNILSHFDVKSLKSALLWSSEVRDLIIKSPELMRKLPVILYGDHWRSKLPFLESYGNYVKAVIFDSCILSGPSELKKVLRQTPNVERVSYKYASFDHESDRTDDADSEDFTLRKLKSLRLELYHDPVSNLLGIFKNCTNIKSFAISALNEEPETVLGEFIAQLDSLERLELSGQSDITTTIDSVFTSEFLERVKFRLKSLSLKCYLCFDVKLSTFLQRQAATLEELAMVNHNMNFHYYRLIFNNFSNLKTLRICIGSILSDARAEEVENLRMPSVTELEFAEYCEDVEVFKTIVGIFPNVEILSGEFGYFSLDGIFEKIPKLRVVISRFSRIEMFMFAKSSSVKAIEFRDVYPLMTDFYWRKLAENCPNIESLTMTDLNSRRLPKAVKIDVDILLSGLENFKNLKHFELRNDNSGYVPVNEDADWPEDGPEIVPHTSKFHLFLDLKARKLAMSSYFGTNFGDLVQRIIEQYFIKEIDNIEIENE